MFLCHKNTCSNIKVSKNTLKENEETTMKFKGHKRQTRQHMIDDEEVMMRSTICAMVCNLRCIWQSEMAFAIRDVAGNHEYGGGYWTDFI